MSQAAILAEDIHKSFRIYHRRHSTLKEALVRRRRGEYEVVQVLDGIDLAVPEGQTLAIIGRNGAGKSTILKVICGLVSPDAGTVTVRGRVSTLLELGAGFAAEYSGAENVYLYGALMGLGRRFIDERFADIVAFSGVGQHIDNPVKTYSSGMYMRLAFAVAVHVDPDVLIIDEVLAVGDQAFQQKCYERAADLRSRGKTIVLVTHDMDAVQRFAERAVWIDNGHIRADGAPGDVVAQYLDEVAATGTDRVAERPPVTVKHLDLRHASGASVGTLRSGEPATVTFDLVSGEAFDGVQVTLRVLIPEDICVVSATTDKLGPTGLAQGTTHVTCSFDSLAVRPGGYRVEVAVRSAAGDVLNRVEPLHFSILGTRVEGVASLPYRWEVSASAEGGPQARGERSHA